LNTHGGDYQCSVCGSTFFQLSNLRYHESKVHGKTNFYDCEVCEEKFTSKSQMNEHLRHDHHIQFTKTVTVYDVDLIEGLYKD